MEKILLLFITVISSAGICFCIIDNASDGEPDVAERISQPIYNLLEGAITAGREEYQ